MLFTTAADDVCIQPPRPPTYLRGGGHIVFGADPSVSVLASASALVSHFFCLHNILWTSGWILTKFSWIYNWDTMNWLHFVDLDPFFKVNAVEKLKILWHFLVCAVSCEPVVEFLLNFHGYILGHNKELIRFCWPWPNFQAHGSYSFLSAQYLLNQY